MPGPGTGQRSPCRTAPAPCRPATPARRRPRHVVRNLPAVAERRDDHHEREAPSIPSFALHAADALERARRCRVDGPRKSCGTSPRHCSTSPPGWQFDCSSSFAISGICEASVARAHRALTAQPSSHRRVGRRCRTAATGELALDAAPAELGKIAARAAPGRGRRRCRSPATSPRRLLNASLLTLPPRPALRRRSRRRARWRRDARVQVVDGEARHFRRAAPEPAARRPVRREVDRSAGASDWPRSRRRARRRAGADVGVELRQGDQLREVERAGARSPAARVAAVSVKANACPPTGSRRWREGAEPERRRGRHVRSGSQPHRRP